MINNKTNLYFSISSNPGSSGSLLHNSYFKMVNKNAIYLPLKVKNLENFINFFKDINSHGFSVSTPFKSIVIKYLDNKDKIVKETLSCNTVIKERNKLYGYNTDYLAIYQILKLNIKNKKSKILILGNGAVTRSVLCALKNLKFENFLVCSRKQKNLPKNQFLNFNKINFCKADVMINATTLGMNIKKKDKLKINQYLIKSLSLIIDFPISQRNSPFLKDVSDKNNIKYISGNEISLLQGINQIKLYNNLNSIVKYYKILKEKIKLKNEKKNKKS